jgi:hypothetical protein
MAQLSSRKISKINGGISRGSESAENVSSAKIISGEKRQRNGGSNNGVKAVA